ncbi:hypothetical protein PMAYCL1PPCAC_28697 [Pristionchus mayeri]|uniref:Uncharacterized protein n=1 Tax=Pristionchus mayeri TaxID=1317129 RepID=A0AAN5D9H6_9BILA|nr:hypothetical protein PMAYCL1PPCAC_28697 [Pristionchus mayeri]
MYCFKRAYREEWHRRPHYILLILCSEYSSTYHEYLNQELVQLDLERNDFLCWNKETGELKCATKLLLQPGQLFAHDVWPEIFVCDTSALIENGRPSVCEYHVGSKEQKSFYGSSACLRRKEKKNENREENRKRLSIQNSSDIIPERKKPFARFNSEPMIHSRNL